MFGEQAQNNKLWVEDVIKPGCAYFPEIFVTLNDARIKSLYDINSEKSLLSIKYLKDNLSINVWENLF